MNRLHPWILAVALAVAGCASAPVRYYTLVSPHAQATTLTPAPYAFELLPVTVPAQVDVPQLVVRAGGQGMQLLDGQRWIAPLGDEIRSAVSADLVHALGVADLSGLPANGTPRLRIKLDVRRFESIPGQRTLIDAAWSLHRVGAGSRPALTCTSRISETVAPGYDALVAGHQQALAALAQRIAVAARGYEAGRGAGCPVD